MTGYAVLHFSGGGGDAPEVKPSHQLWLHGPAWP